jgi:hypothetical protein
MIALLAGEAMPQVRTKHREKPQSTSSTASQIAPPSGAAGATTAVTGSGIQGQLIKWAGSDGSGIAGDSIITETKLGNIGIGTKTPGSKLSVQGMIETTLGGYKFPDGTIQTTALSAGQVVSSLNNLKGNVTLAAGANIAITPNGNTLTIAAPNLLTKVAHDSTLTGDGTAANPLGFAAPLFFTGSAFANQGGLFHVNNIASGGLAIFASGGNADSNNRGGVGLQAQGGNGDENTGGNGLLSAGGVGINHDGGAGGIFFGGFGNNGSGGDGLIVQAGDARVIGHKGGRGIFVTAGRGSEGATDGLAGEFKGDVSISGNLSKGGGSFKIDHPLDPENKYLYHSFVESPDMMNIYNGTVTTDQNGDATVTLPDWFEALNQDFRYQLTVIGTFAQAIVSEKVKGNHFTVKTNAANVEVSWQVTGIRHDAYANKHRISVEEQKPEDERGLYLHPDAFNKPEAKGVHFTKMASSKPKE